MEKIGENWSGWMERGHLKASTVDEPLTCFNFEYFDTEQVEHINYEFTLFLALFGCLPTRFRPRRHHLQPPGFPGRHQTQPANRRDGQQPTAVPAPHAQVSAPSPGRQPGNGDRLYRRLLWRTGGRCSAARAEVYTTWADEQVKREDRTGTAAILAHLFGCRANYT